MHITLAPRSPGARARRDRRWQWFVDDDIGAVPKGYLILSGATLERHPTELVLIATHSKVVLMQSEDQDEHELDDWETAIRGVLERSLRETELTTGYCSTPAYVDRRTEASGPSSASGGGALFSSLSLPTVSPQTSSTDATPRIPDINSPAAVAAAVARFRAVANAPVAPRATPAPSASGVDDRRRRSATATTVTYALSDSDDDDDSLAVGKTEDAWRLTSFLESLPIIEHLSAALLAARVSTACNGM